MCADPEIFRKGGLGRGELRGGWGRVNVLNVNIHIYQRKIFMHKPFSFVCYVFLLFFIINVFCLLSIALFYEFDRFFKVQKGWRVHPPINQCMRENRHEQNNQPTIYIVYVNNKDCSER